MRRQPGSVSPGGHRAVGPRWPITTPRSADGKKEQQRLPGRDARSTGIGGNTPPESAENSSRANLAPCGAKLPRSRAKLIECSDCAGQPGGCGCHSNPSVGHESRVESSDNGLATNRENGQDTRSSGDARQRPRTRMIREVHPSCTSGDSRTRFRNCRPIDVGRPRCQQRGDDLVQCEPDDGGSSLGIMPGGAVGQAGRGL